MGEYPPARRGVGKWLAGARDVFVSVIFPANCRLCEALLTRGDALPICDACLVSALPIEGPLCFRCGLPLPAVPAGGRDQDTLCRFCAETAYAFDRARSYTAYQGPVVRAILLLKFERIEALGRWFAERLANVAERGGLRDAVDVVVPVPLHRDRERERGYNQAELIAKPLAKRLKLPYQAVLLMRTRPRPNKHILTNEERWKAVRGAFATRPGSQVDNLRVLLVDDVMTTGATFDACAQALRKAGAKSVIALTVARAINNPQPDSHPWKAL